MMQRHTCQTVESTVGLHLFVEPKKRAIQQKMKRKTPNYQQNTILHKILSCAGVGVIFYFRMDTKKIKQQQEQ